MPSLHTDALVLRAIDFGESDRIVSLLTPDRGRITAIAKGAKRSQRRFPGTLDLFNLLHVQIAPNRRANAMLRLEHSKLSSAFQSLREHPGRYAMACYLVELLDRLAPEGGAPEDLQRLYSFAVEALQIISEREPDARLRVLLELRALSAMGLRPELRLCVRCGNELKTQGQVQFHVAEGGPVCPNCTSEADLSISVHLGTLRLLEQSLRFDFQQLDRLAFDPRALEQTVNLMRRFQRFHVGVELRSDRFLSEILHSPAPSPPA